MTNTSLRSFAINPSGHIFAGTAGGVFRSIDNGDNWTQTGLIGIIVWTVAINSSGNIFAGTQGSGVFRSVESTISVDEIYGRIPSSFALFQNYPNPFNPSTIINYSLPNESAVTITIYDMLGKEIDQLISQKQPSGKHSIQWNGIDHDGNIASAGIYLYQITAGDFVQTKKMVLMK